MSASRAVVLVGLRATGKSTVGARLGAALGWPVRDGDALLAEAVGEPAGAHLRRVGEAAFRAVEERVSLAAVAAPRPFVLALGGGAVQSAALRAALTAAPDLLVVGLRADLATLVVRLRADAVDRPRLVAGELEDEIRTLAARRQAWFDEVVGLWIDTTVRSPAEAADDVRAALAGVGGG